MWVMALAAASAATQPTAPAGHGGAASTPADRLDRLDRFRDGLPQGDRRRLDEALPRSADGGIAGCDDVDGSRASCEAAAYLPALRSTGLMARFLATTGAAQAR